MATIRAAGARKTVGEDAAGQVPAEVPFDVPQERFAVRIPGTRLLQPRFQMPLHHLIYDGTFRPPRLIDRGAGRRGAGLGGTGRGRRHGSQVRLATFRDGRPRDYRVEPACRVL
jgi:hypothetical protein